VKVLLDEMLPVGVADLLPAQAVTTVRAAGYAGLSNGELIRRQMADGFHVLVTADRNLPAQQNIPTSGIAVVLVTGNRISQIEPYVGALDEAIATAVPGTVTRVGRSS